MTKYWKTTIEIYSDIDPDTQELEDLARRATSDDMICTKQDSVEVEKKDLEPEAYEFFGPFWEDDDEDL